MSKSLQVAGRTITWVKDEPGPVIILIIALALIFGVRCFIPDATSTPVQQNTSVEQVSAN